MTETRVTPRARLTFASGYGLLGVMLAAAAHASTFTGDPLRPDHPLFWILHIGIFPLFFPMLFRMRGWTERTSGPLGIPKSRVRWRELQRYFPRWAVALAGIVFVYAMLNFVNATSHFPNGRADVSGAGTLDEARYAVRAFSGHWLIFYTLPTLFFLFVPATARPSETINT